MYTREILPPRASPVEDGIPVIGTWNRAFLNVDLLEIRKPYNYLPRWARDYRIKEWEYFNVQDDRFLLSIIFCNAKYFRAALVQLYDRIKNERYAFKTAKPGNGWKLPQSLCNSSVDSQSPEGFLPARKVSDFHFHIHSWLDADTVKLDMSIEASRRRPSFTAHLAYKTNDITPIAVSLMMGGRQHDQRIMYAYKTPAPVSGKMVFAGKQFIFNQENCSGFFCDYKGFFPYRMQTTICSATGFFNENERFGFHIAENQTRGTNRNNENALWVNGQLTLLPPVLITMPGGLDSQWVIQDVEGMVDLTFTPISYNKNGIEWIIINAEVNTPVGYFNGMLVTSEGRKMQIKNLLGLGEKIYLRA